MLDMAPYTYAGGDGSGWDKIPGYLSAMLGIRLESVGSKKEADALLERAIPDPSLRAFLLMNLTTRKRPSLGTGSQAESVQPPHAEAVARLSWRVGLEELEAALPVLAAWDLGTALSPYMHRVLFVAGGRSHYLRPKHAGAIERHFPNARLRNLTSASHWVHVEEPVELANQLVTFLSEPQPNALGIDGEHGCANGIAPHGRLLRRLWSDAEREWAMAWRARLECWYLGLPIPTRRQLEGCTAALALHLGSRISASWRAMGGGSMGTAALTSAPEAVAASGCEWVGNSELLSLPEVPEFPRTQFTLPPIPSLMPSWAELQGWRLPQEPRMRHASVWRHFSVAMCAAAGAGGALFMLAATISALKRATRTSCAGRPRLRRPTSVRRS